MTVPDWLLERYALGELSPEERAELEADPDLPAQLAALQASDAEVLKRYPVRAVTARARERRRTNWRPLGLLVSAALALFVVGVGLQDDGIRAKGDLQLLVHRKTEAGAERLTPGARAEAGDILQLEVSGATSVYGWLLSIDGDGTVTFHNDGRLDAPPRALKLDDAAGYEHFYVVVSDAPLKRSSVRQAAEQAPRSPEGVVLDLPQADEAAVWVRKP